MKNFLYFLFDTGIIVLIIGFAFAFGLYFHFHPVAPQEQPQIEVIVPEIRKPAPKYEPKPLYVDPKYECKGCK